MSIVFLCESVSVVMWRRKHAAHSTVLLDRPEHTCHANKRKSHAPVSMPRAGRQLTPQDRARLLCIQLQPNEQGTFSLDRVQSKTHPAMQFSCQERVVVGRTRKCFRPEMLPRTRWKLSTSSWVCWFICTTARRWEIQAGGASTTSTRKKYSIKQKI